MIYSARLPADGLGFCVVKSDNENTYNVTFTLDLSAALKDLNSKNLFTGENEYFTMSPIYFTSNITVNGTQVASCTDIKITDSLTSYNFDGAINIYNQLNANKITQEIKCNLTLTHPKFILKYESEPITFLATKSIQKTSLIDKNNGTVATVLETPLNTDQIEEAKRNGIVVFNTDPQFLILGNYHLAGESVANPKFTNSRGLQLSFGSKNYAKNGTAASARYSSSYELSRSKYTASIRYVYSTSYDLRYEDAYNYSSRGVIDTEYLKTAGLYFRGTVYYAMESLRNFEQPSAEPNRYYEYRYRYTLNDASWSYKINVRYTSTDLKIDFNYSGKLSFDTVQAYFSDNDGAYHTARFDGWSSTSSSSYPYKATWYIDRLYKIESNGTTTVTNRDYSWGKNNQVYAGKGAHTDTRDCRQEYRVDRRYNYTIWDVYEVCYRWYDSGGMSDSPESTSRYTMNASYGYTLYYTSQNKYRHDLKSAWDFTTYNRASVYFGDSNARSTSLIAESHTWKYFTHREDVYTDTTVWSSYYLGRVDYYDYYYYPFGECSATTEQTGKYTYTYNAYFRGWNIDSNGLLRYINKNKQAVEYTEKYS